VAASITIDGVTLLAGFQQAATTPSLQTDVSTLLWQSTLQALSSQAVYVGNPWSQEYYRFFLFKKMTVKKKFFFLKLDRRANTTTEWRPLETAPP